MTASLPDRGAVKMTRTRCVLAAILCSGLAACTDPGFRGTVTEVDPESRTIVVTTEKFQVPENVTVNWGDLSPGTQILLRYKDRGVSREITDIATEAQ